jgi:PKD repeat protein
MQQRTDVETYLRNKYAPKINLGPDIYVSGFCPVTLNAGSGFTNYKWHNNATTSSVQVLAPGTYYVSATDIFGYPTSDTIKVFFPGNTAVFRDTSLCLGDTLIVDPQLNPAFSFAWSNGATTSTLLITQPGNYRLTATDLSACSWVFNSFNVTADSLQLKINLGDTDTTLCGGNTIGLVSGASLVATYLWQPGNQTTASVIANSPGIYSVQVTGTAGCVAYDSINVSITGQALASINFSADTACFGSPASFIDSSVSTAPDVIASRQWLFEPGQSASGVSVQHTFSSAGVFNVRLTVTTSGGCVQSLTKPVLVRQNPVVSFSAPAAGCIPVAVDFSNNSSAAPGDPIASFLWNFGDSQSDTAANPSHFYAAAGNYSVSLTASSVNGCSQSFSAPISIVASAPPAPAVTLNAPPHLFITAGSSVLFNWNTVPNVFKYRLDVATDSTFSNFIFQSSVLNNSVSSLSVNNLTTGNYFWRVIAFNACNVPTASAVFSFKIIDFASLGLSLWLKADDGSLSSGPVAQWNDQSGNGFHAAQADPNARPVFIPAVAGLNNKPVIRFDGVDDLLNGVTIPNINNSSISAFIVFNGYAQAGIAADILRFGDGSGHRIVRRMFSENLALVNNGNLLDATPNSSPNAGFGYLIWSSIKNYNTITNVFLNGSNAGSSNDVGLNGTFTNGNYAIGNTVGAQNLSGDIAEIIIFNAALSTQQRTDVETYLRNKYAPKINLGPDIYVSGFCPVTLNAGDGFSSYLWNTGETTSSIVINGQGNYFVEAVNFLNETSRDTVQISFTASVNFVDDTICLGQNKHYITLLDTAIYSFLWSTGATTNTINVNTEGTYSVLIDDGTGCVFADTFYLNVDSFAITKILGNDTSLCNGNTVSILNGLQSGITYQWSTSETTSSIVIQNTGNYSLTATTSKGCQSIDSIFVTISGIAPVANFDVSNTCKGDSTFFTDSSYSQDVNHPIVTWNYSFGDSGISNIPNPSHLYNAAGDYLVTLTVITDTGCVGSFSKYIEVSPKPAADFSSLISCAGTETQFIDLTTIATGSITQWSWNFGTGDTSNLQNPQYVFPGQGEYNVTLISVSNKDCSDTVTKKVEVFKELIADFETAGVTCYGDSTKFIDKTNSFSIVKWNWEFNDDNNGTSTRQSPAYTFPNVGAYNIKLSVTNAIGCMSDTIITIEIYEAPEAEFSVSSNCIGQLTQFTDSSDAKGDSILRHFWNFGDSTPTVRAFNPIYLYDTTGNFVVTHYIITKSGCSASISKTVSVVMPPSANFSYTPDFGAAPLPVNFSNASSADVRDFLWQFGDADNSTSVSENPVFTYTSDNTYTVKLIVKNDVGCTDSITKNVKVAPAILDLAVKSISVQQELMNDGNYKILTVAEIQNVGTRNVFSFDISCIAGTLSPIIETWEGFLQGGGDRIFYSFASSFISIDEKNKTYVCVETLYPNNEEDENHLNDKLCVALEDKIKIIPPYPSPGSGMLNFGIILPKKSNLDITVFSVTGAELLNSKKEYLKGYNNIQIDRSGLSKGMYIIRITFGEENYYGKFIAD